MKKTHKRHNVTFSKDSALIKTKGHKTKIIFDFFALTLINL